ncbi:MAG: T9SS type A sorting domain-containing protein [Bacteroidia bacterium]
MKTLKFHIATGFIAASTFLNGQIINTIAGDGTTGYTNDGYAATGAELNSPNGVVIDGLGNIYIADFGNNRVRKVNTAGIITTFAGNGSTGDAGDGAQATAAEVGGASALAIDKSGNIYITGTGLGTRVVSTSGIITTLAGTTTLTGFTGIAVDGSGDVYLAQESFSRVYKINAGVASIFAGNSTAGYSGDGGQASAAELGQPYGVAVDGSGNIYIADYTYGCIRKVNSSGIISTFAGGKGNGYSGDGGPATAAELHYPYGVTTDGIGDVFIADYYNNRIREINMSDTILTIAGTGTPGFSGDGGQATSAEISYPRSVALDAAGNIYIADWGNVRIRKISSTATGINEIIESDKVNVYPIPNDGQMSIRLSGNGYNSIHIYDMLGREVYTQLLDARANNANVEVNLGANAEGAYIMCVQTHNGVIYKKILVTH